MSLILLVDDDAALLRTLSINLPARGCEVATAADGEAALVQLRGAFPDAVILDVGLPGSPA